MMLGYLKKRVCRIDNYAFTLIEVMVALVIFGLVIGAIYKAYQSQLKAYITNEARADLNSNLRGVMQMIQEDIRMAGFNPTGTAAEAGINIAERNKIKVSMDFMSKAVYDDEGKEITESKWGGDGLINVNQGEEAYYALIDGKVVNTEVSQDNSDHTDKLMSVSPDIYIEALDFLYFDRKGDCLNEKDNDTDTGIVPESDIPRIRSVQVTIIAATGKTAPVLSYKHTDSRTYQNREKEEILSQPNDQVRRAVLTCEINFRNIRS